MRARFEMLAERLDALAAELESLGSEAEDIGALYVASCGSEPWLAAVLAGRLYAETHEAASATGFSLDRLRRMERFVRFRHAYRNLDMADVRLIVDVSPLPLAEKARLLSLFPDKRQGLAFLAAMREEWNEAFGNRSFDAILGLFADSSRPVGAD